MNPDVISVHALETEEYRDRLKAAEVIMGVDVDSGHEFLVFGRDCLQRIIDRNETESIAVVRVSLDQDTDELEWLCAAVQVLKGRDEYEGRGPTQ